MSGEKKYFKIKKVPDYLENLNKNVNIGDIVTMLDSDNAHGALLLEELNGKYTCYLSYLNLITATKEEAMKYLFKDQS